MPLLCSPDALVVEAVRFAAGPYRLEGELAYPDTAAPVGAAVVAGPHPLLGGSIHNNVVRGLGNGLARHGFVTLRFNYQGVGQSEGPAADIPAHLAQFWQTSRAPDESKYQADLSAAIAFLHTVVGRATPVALIGYSFGCSLLPAAVPAIDPASVVILVAPTIGPHDYGAFEGVRNPKLVIAPEGDFATDSERLLQWFARLPAPKQIVRPRLDGHFFRGYEDWLVATIGAFIDTDWS